MEPEFQWDELPTDLQQSLVKSTDEFYAGGTRLATEYLIELKNLIH